MNSHVDFKTFTLCETLSTVFAGERFLSSVNSHVYFKGFILSKTFSTLLAGETSSSGPLSSFSCGSLFSLRAAKIFFFRYEIRIFLNQVLLFIFIQFLTLLFHHLQV